MFTDSHINIATTADIPAVMELLNSAYRGESSKNGWTTEAHLISGDTRSDAATLKDVIERKGSVLLRYEGDTKTIIGCVNLQEHDDKMYLGMLAVSPFLQGGGIGKKLLKVAEEYAHNTGCDSIYMTVITLRTELIDWYKRHGYIDTGERKPFHEDGRSGKHLEPLEFMVLEKKL